MQEYLQFAPAACFFFAVTILVSLYAFSRPDVLHGLMLSPYEVSRGHRLHTVLTSGFVHADYAHLAFNMFTFYFFAFPLEAYMAQTASTPLTGHILFAILYLLSMALADVYTILRHRDNPDYHSLGASGAIAAVMFGFILFQPGSSLSIMFFPIPIPAPVFAVLYMLFTYFSGRKKYDNINHDTHLWGAVSGVVFTAVCFPQILPGFVAEIQRLAGSYLPSL